MDQTSFQNFMNGEHDSLLSSIDLFRTLLPHKEHEASVHHGEEGRFIELALSQYLREKLPASIGVGGGFITDVENNWNSRQIDIILYDAAQFAPLMRYGDAVVVPVQAVVGAISVKRTLYKSQVKGELAALSEIGSHMGGRGFPKPYLSIVAFRSEQDDFEKASAETFELIKKYYAPKKDIKNRLHYFSWNELIDSIIVFDKFIIKGDNFLKYENKQGRSSYLSTGGSDARRSLYIQHLLNGIHRAWYDTRRGGRWTGKLLAIPGKGMKQRGHVAFCVHDRLFVDRTFIPAMPDREELIAALLSDLKALATQRVFKPKRVPKRSPASVTRVKRTNQRKINAMIKS